MESLLASVWGNWLDCGTMNQGKDYERMSKDGEEDNSFHLE